MIHRINSPGRRTFALTSLFKRSPSSSAVTSRSYCDCNPSQNSADVPKNFASRRAVSAVIPRLRRTISLILRGGTPILRASLFWLIPIGLRNYSESTSPGCIGCSLFFITLSFNDNLLFPHRMLHPLSR